MPRVEIHNMTQGEFLKKIKSQCGFTYDQLASVAHCHRRSFSDWASGKILMPLQVFQNLSKLVNFKSEYAILPDYWHIEKAAKKGGEIRNKLYGSPGTKEGRKLGGQTSAARFKENPELARLLGFVVTKPLVFPPQSELFGELVGIILGDGSISRYQVRITLNANDDKEYVDYVCGLIESLLQVIPSRAHRDAVTEITVSRVLLVEYLKEVGLMIGGKVRQQVEVPKWIRDSEEYSKACIRGLFDTDGCFYVDHHKYKEKLYKHAAICFTNYSKPILNFFDDILKGLGFHPTRRSANHVFLRRRLDIQRFFKEIKPANMKHVKKFNMLFE